MSLSKDGCVVPEPCGLCELNSLNRRVFELMGKPASQISRGSGRGNVSEAMPYGHPYFISHTECVSPGWGGTHSFRSMKNTLGKLRPGLTDFDLEMEYEREGLHALRCFVMNPFYQVAAEGDPENLMDYLGDFVVELHTASATVVDELFGTVSVYVLVETTPATATAVVDQLAHDVGVAQARVVAGVDGCAVSVVIEARGRSESIGAVVVRRVRECGSVLRTETLWVVRLAQGPVGASDQADQPDCYALIGIEGWAHESVANAVSQVKGVVKTDLVYGGYDIVAKAKAWDGLRDALDDIDGVRQVTMLRMG